MLCWNRSAVSKRAMIVISSERWNAQIAKQQDLDVQEAVVEAHSPSPHSAMHFSALGPGKRCHNLVSSTLLVKVLELIAVLPIQF